MMDNSKVLPEKLHEGIDGKLWASHVRVFGPHPAKVTIRNAVAIKNNPENLPYIFSTHYFSVFRNSFP